MGKTSRRKFTPEFKPKVALEALKESSTKGDLAKKYEISPAMILNMNMNMNIRRAVVADVERVMPLYERAREYMVSYGNPSQWVGGYPAEPDIRKDVDAGRFFVMECAGEVVGAFCFYVGVDPCYAVIEDGEWLNDEPYGVVHRLVGCGAVKGVGRRCFEWCASQCRNLRVDTHRDNAPMLHIIESLGFTRCGVITVANGTKREAFQLCRKQ